MKIPVVAPSAAAILIAAWMVANGLLNLDHLQDIDMQSALQFGLHKTYKSPNY